MAEADGQVRRRNQVQLGRRDTTVEVLPASLVLRKLGSLDIRGADVVEVAPAYDHADITAIAGATIAMYYLGLLAERKERR